MAKEKTESQSAIAFYPSLVPKTGGHLAAAVLSQIMYWHTGRLRVSRHGTFWLAKSREELCQEVSMTIDQYKRVMPELQKQGWITMEIGVFSGKVTPHIQLTDQGVQELSRLCPGWNLATNQLGVKATTPLVQKPTNQLGVKHANQLGVNPTTPYTETTTGNTAEITEQAPSAGEPMKAQDILKTIQEKNPTSVEGLWKKRMSLLHPGYQKMTIKESAQLRAAAKGMGALAVPAIDWALQNWMVFALQAKKDKGAFTPEVPNPGYLLMHYQSLATAYALAHPPPKPKLVVVQSIAKPEAQKPEVEDNAVLTEAEIQADLLFFTKKGKP